jgi:coiled-coil domain-containing protein 130
MSTLKATQADGYYVPNDPSIPYKPGKKFPSTVRFEMPFHIWCNGCKNKIAKGVRFNARKKVVGDYLSTKILAFSMRCPRCGNVIVVKTDPKTTEFLVAEGGQRKNEDYTAESAEAMKLEGHEERLKNVDNGFLKLEKEARDKRIGVSAPE